jgi:hypothetical protein
LRTPSISMGPNTFEIIRSRWLPSDRWRHPQMVHVRCRGTHLELVIDLERGVFRVCK